MNPTARGGHPHQRQSGAIRLNPITTPMGRLGQTIGDYDFTILGLVSVIGATDNAPGLVPAAFGCEQPAASFVRTSAINHSD